MVLWFELLIKIGLLYDQIEIMLEGFFSVARDVSVQFWKHEFISLPQYQRKSLGANVFTHNRTIVTIGANVFRHNGLPTARKKAQAETNRRGNWYLIARLHAFNAITPSCDLESATNREA